MSVTVQGPDGNNYEFPDGTDKAKAIAYFKKKGITGVGAAPDDDFTANPKGEGLYPMSGVLGDIQVPFSRVMDASGAGYKVDYRTRIRYRNDAQADWWKKFPERVKTDPELQKRVRQQQAQAPAAGVTPGAINLPSAAGTPLLRDEDIPLPDVVPEAPHWWDKARSLVQDVTQPTHVTPGTPSADLFNPATVEMGLNTLKRIGANVFGMVDAPMQAIRGFYEMASGDPTLGQAGEERLLGLTPHAQVVGRLQEARANLQQPDLGASNIAGDILTVKGAPEAAEWSLKRARDLTGLPRRMVKGLVGTGSDQTRRAVEDEKVGLAEEQRVNEEKKQQFLKDIEKAKSEDALEMAAHRSDVLDVEAQNIKSKAEHEAAQTKKRQDWQDLQTQHEQGQQATRAREESFEPEIYNQLKKLDEKVGKAARDEYQAVNGIMMGKGVTLPLDKIQEGITKAKQLIRGSKDTVPIIEVLATENAPLDWNNMQGYYEEFNTMVRTGEIPPGTYKGIESMRDFFRDQMSVLAENAGMGGRWAKARKGFETYKETFDNPASPISKAVNARTPADALGPLMRRGVLEYDDAVKALNIYDPALGALLRQARDVHRRALKATKAPKELQPGKAWKPTDLEAPGPGPKVALPEFKSRPEFDLVEGKKQVVRDWARKNAGLSSGEMFFLISSPIGFALNGHTFGALLGDAGYVLARKLIIAKIDTPKALEWLSRPNAKDLAHLEKLPPEVQASAKAKLRDFIEEQNRANAKLGKRIQVARPVAAWLGVESVGQTTDAERRAREAAQRLQAAPSAP